MMTTRKNFKPILFSTAMVQAILEGRKTQTRRIIKPKPDAWVSTIPYKETSKKPHKDKSIWVEDDGTKYEPLIPKFEKGHILWVRETWCESNNHKSLNRDYLYKEKILRESSLRPKWKPSIFMPKAACRIFLEVTNVRVERLQNISAEDAIAEGIEIIENEEYGRVFRHYFMGDQEHYFKVPELSFKTLWQSINGLKSWDANPWVWVYEFQRVEKPQNFLP